MKNEPKENQNQTTVGPLPRRRSIVEKSLSEVPTVLGTPVERSSWRGIGRSVVIFVAAPESVAAELGQDPNAVVVHHGGSASELAELSVLHPGLVDVAVLGVPSGREGETLSLAHALRRRFLSSVLLVPPGALGESILRNHLGAFVYPNGVATPQLWLMIAAAAQETWALGWIMRTRSTPHSPVVRLAESTGHTRGVPPPPVNRTKIS